nr:splicing factor [Tanacetum cinerariifolium]
MVTFTVDLYHDGYFISNPLQYVYGEHRLINDLDIESTSYDDFFPLIRRLTLDKPLAIFYNNPSFSMTLGVKQISNDEQVDEFVQALSENDLRLSMCTEHQGYDVLEMVQNDNLCDDASDSDFEDVDKSESLEDLNHVVDFQTEGEENVVIPKLSTDDPWDVDARKYAGKR